MPTTLENTLIRFNDGTTQSTAATSPPAASTSVAGIVQLSTATDSTSTTLAATASAVKAAYDLAAGKADASHSHSYLGYDINYNAVGSLCFARNTSSTTKVNPGSTIAGSNLRPANASGGVVNTTLSGTWRALGYAPYADPNYLPSSTTLWQRIS